MEVVVLEIDGENRRLSLGHKQLEENPWDVFETVFTIDSIHQGTVMNVNDKGATIGLTYGVEGFCPARHLAKAEGGSLKGEERPRLLPHPSVAGHTPAAVHRPRGTRLQTERGSCLVHVRHQPDPFTGRGLSNFVRPGTPASPSLDEMKADTPGDRYHDDQPHPVWKRKVATDVATECALRDLMAS